MRSDKVSIRAADTLIRHYLHTDPDTLDDDKWAMLYADALELLKAKSKQP